MHAVYEYLQRNYKIGPMQLIDGQPQEKPFQEYPKWITDASGKRVIVKDLQEEIRVAGKQPEGAPADPLQAERDKLGAESQKLTDALKEVEELKAQMRAQLDELEQARANLQNPAKAASEPLKEPPKTPGSPAKK